MVSEEYEVTEKHIRRMCDEKDCDKEARHSCGKCGKDLCGWMANGHAIEDPYDTCDDYPTYICEKCLEIGELFRKIIDECREKEYNALDEWELKCKASKDTSNLNKLKEDIS